MNLPLTIAYLSLGIYSLVSSDATCLRIFVALTLYIDASMIWNNYQESKKIKSLLQRLMEPKEKQK